MQDNNKKLSFIARLILGSINETIFFFTNQLYTNIVFYRNNLENIIKLSKEKNKEKDVIFFIHGLRGNLTDFKFIIEELQDSNYYLDNYDSKEDQTIEEDTNAIIEKINTLAENKNIILIGHSRGGCLAYNTYKKIQNKRKISKIICIASPLNTVPEISQHADNIEQSVNDFYYGKTIYNALKWIIEKLLKITQAEKDFKSMNFNPDKTDINSKLSIYCAKFDTIVGSYDKQIPKDANNVKILAYGHMSILQSKEIISSLKNELKCCTEQPTAANAITTEIQNIVNVNPSPDQANDFENKPK